MKEFIKIYIREIKNKKEISHFFFSIFIMTLNIYYFNNIEYLKLFPLKFHAFFLVINTIQFYKFIKIPTDYYNFLYRFIYFNYPLPKIKKNLIICFLSSQ